MTLQALMLAFSAQESPGENPSTSHSSLTARQSVDGGLKHSTGLLSLRTRRRYTPAFASPINPTTIIYVLANKGNGGDESNFGLQLVVY